MKNLLITLILILSINNHVFSQDKFDFESNFTYYNITEFKDGMQFMVEPDGYFINPNFKEYHKKGRGKEINLNSVKGQIYTFKRYETRELKCLHGKCSYLFLIFDKEGKEYEFNTYKTRDELIEMDGESFKTNIQEFIFYDDILQADKLLRNKEFYLIKSISFNHFGENRLYKITNIKPKTSDYPIEIEYIDIESNKKFTIKFRLSGTNERHTCESYLGACEFSKYFMPKNEFEAKKEKEKGLIISYGNSNLKVKPEENSEIELKIMSGDKLRFLGYKNDHYFVSVKGKKGYIQRYDALFTLSDKMKKIRDSVIKLELKEQTEKRKFQTLNECAYYKNEVDEFTGNKKIFTEPYNLNEIDLSIGEISIELRRIENSRFIWFHSYRDLGCTSSYDNNKSYVKIKLENNDILTFHHIGDVDCSEFSLLTRLTLSDINRLKKSPIKTIRLSGTDYYHDVKVVKWNTFFADKLKCIE